MTTNSSTLVNTILPFIGKEITIFKLNSFGFPTSTKCKLVNVIKRKYAQYDNAVHISFIPKGKRKPVGMIYRGYDDSIIIYAGFVELNANMFTSDETNELGTIRKSELCFSNKYYENALKSTSHTPLINFIR